MIMRADQAQGALYNGSIGYWGAICKPRAIQFSRLPRLGQGEG